MLWLGLEGRKKISKLETGFEQLENDLAKFRRECQSLEMEWSETLERINAAMARIGQRARRAGGEPVPAPAVQDEFSHLDPVSADIMRRRRRHGVG